MKHINFKPFLFLAIITLTALGCQKEDDITNPTVANERFKVPSVSDAKSHFETYNKVNISSINELALRIDEAEMTIKWDESETKKYKDETQSISQKIDILYTPIELNIKGNAKIFLASINDEGTVDSKYIFLFYTKPDNPKLFSGYVLIYNLDGNLENIYQYKEGDEVQISSNNRIAYRNDSDGNGNGNGNGFSLGEILDWIGNDWFGLDGFITNEEVEVFAQAADGLGDSGFGNTGDWSHSGIHIPILNNGGGSGNDNNGSNVDDIDWWKPNILFAHGLTLIDAIEVDLSSIEANWLLNTATQDQLDAIAIYLNSVNQVNGGGFYQSDIDFIINIINNLLYSTSFTYDESDYPGKEEGLPFQWWLDDDFIKNSGHFNIRLITFLGTLPNDMEVLLFMLFHNQALLHLENASAARAKTEELVDSGILPDDGTGYSKANAFLHASWNALGAAEIGVHITKLFADAHEYGETGLATEMDYHNNHKGRIIGSDYNIFTPDDVIFTPTYNAVLDGTLKYINSNGVLVPTNQ